MKQSNHERAGNALHALHSRDRCSVCTAGSRAASTQEHFAFQAPRQRINWKKVRQVNLERLVSDNIICLKPKRDLNP
jgi:hypothetical protein